MTRSRRTLPASFFHLPCVPAAFVTGRPSLLSSPADLLLLPLLYGGVRPPKRCFPLRQDSYVVVLSHFGIRVEDPVPVPASPPLAVCVRDLSSSSPSPAPPPAESRFPLPALHPASSALTLDLLRQHFHHFHLQQDLNMLMLLCQSVTAPWPPGRTLWQSPLASRHLCLPWTGITASECGPEQAHTTRALLLAPCVDQIAFLLSRTVLFPSSASDPRS